MEVSQPLTPQPQKVPLGRPRAFTNVEEMQQAIDAYFIEQDAKEKPYTMAGLARALDCDSSTLRRYEHESHAPLEFCATVKKARARVEEWTEARLYGKGHPAGPIFSLKNNFGWKDQIDVEHRHEVLIGQPGSNAPMQLEPPVIDITPLSPAMETRSALSPAPEMAVSGDRAEAKAPPIEGVSPSSVA